MRQIQTPLQGAAEKSCRKSCGKNGNTSGQHPAARRKKPENDNQRMNTGERAAKSDEASSHPKICFYTAGSGDVPAGASGLQWIRIRTGTAAENTRIQVRIGLYRQITRAEGDREVGDCESGSVWKIRKTETLYREISWCRSQAASRNQNPGFMDRSGSWQKPGRQQKPLRHSGYVQAIPGRRGRKQHRILLQISYTG